PVVTSTSTKMREVELLACNKKTKKSYDNMVTRLRWEAACVGNSDSVRALYDNSAPIFVKETRLRSWFLIPACSRLRD
ncbi:hypothetical protein HID58_028441, partial [Brassica napus]